jgi:hypothetical protein
MGPRLVLTAGLVASAVGLLILSASGVSTPPLLSEAGIGSAINDLDRELGGAFGVGLLGSLTLARYESTVSGAHPALPPVAREGLAQAIAAPRMPAAIQAAWTAFSDGLEIAMAVGSACVLATAVVVAWKMPRHNPTPPAGSVSERAQ